MKNRIDKAIAATDIALKTNSGGIMHAYLTRIRSLLMDLKDCNIIDNKTAGDLDNEELNQLFKD